MEKKFYQKKWFTILALIVCFPIGIILMWANKFFTLKTRAILTVLVPIIVWSIQGASNNPSKTSSKTINAPVKVVEEQSSKEQNTEEVIAVEETKELIEEQNTATYTLEELVEMDKVIWAYILEAEELKELVNGCYILLADYNLANSQIAEARNLLNNSKSQLDSLYLEVLRLKNEINADYIQTVANLCLEVSSLCKSLIKYIDKEEIKYLSEAQNYINNFDIITMRIVREKILFFTNQNINIEDIPSADSY